MTLSPGVVHLPTGHEQLVSPVHHTRIEVPPDEAELHIQGGGRRQPLQHLNASEESSGEVIRLDVARLLVGERPP